MRPEITFQAHKAYTKNKALSKLRVANMAKLRDTRDASSDESCNEMREHIGKEKQNEIGKL